jgi:hypothetical protein
MDKASKILSTFTLAALSFIGSYFIDRNRMDNEKENVDQAFHILTKPSNVDEIGLKGLMERKMSVIEDAAYTVTDIFQSIRKDHISHEREMKRSEAKLLGLLGRAGKKDAIEYLDKMWSDFMERGGRQSFEIDRTLVDDMALSYAQISDTTCYSKLEHYIIFNGNTQQTSDVTLEIMLKKNASFRDAFKQYLMKNFRDFSKKSNRRSLGEKRRFGKNYAITLSNFGGDDVIDLLSEVYGKNRNYANEIVRSAKTRSQKFHAYKKIRDLFSRWEGTCEERTYVYESGLKILMEKINADMNDLYKYGMPCENHSRCCYNYGLVGQSLQCTEKYDGCNCLMNTR